MLFYKVELTAEGNVHETSSGKVKIDHSRKSLYSWLLLLTLHVADSRR